MHAGEVLPRAAPADMRVSAGWLRRKAAAPKQEEEEKEKVPLPGKMEQGVINRVGVLRLRLAVAQWLRWAFVSRRKATPGCLCQQSHPMRMTRVCEFTSGSEATLSQCHSLLLATSAFLQKCVIRATTKNENHRQCP